MQRNDTDHEMSRKTMVLERGAEGDGNKLLAGIVGVFQAVTR